MPLGLSKSSVSRFPLDAGEESVNEQDPGMTQIGTYSPHPPMDIHTPGINVAVLRPQNPVY